MKFRTPYNEMKPVFCNPGKRFKTVYEMAYDEKGHKVLKAVGTTDVQAAIDSEFESVDLNMILKRLVNGDEDALNRADAFYADVSELPMSYREILDLNMSAQKVFAGLPEDVRKVYGNDFIQFLADPGKIEMVMKRKQAKVKEDEKEIEVKHDDEE